MQTLKPKPKARPFCLSVKGHVKLLRLVRAGPGDWGAESQLTPLLGDKAAEYEASAPFSPLFRLCFYQGLLKGKAFRLTPWGSK